MRNCIVLRTFNAYPGGENQGCNQIAIAVSENHFCNYSDIHAMYLNMYENKKEWSSFELNTALEVQA